jgi:hypothetical protein
LTTSANVLPCGSSRNSSRVTRAFALSAPPRPRPSDIHSVAIIEHTNIAPPFSECAMAIPRRPCSHPHCGAHQRFSSKRSAVFSLTGSICNYRAISSKLRWQGAPAIVPVRNRSADATVRGISRTSHDLRQKRVEMTRATQYAARQSIRLGSQRTQTAR